MLVKARAWPHDPFLLDAEHENLTTKNRGQRTKDSLRPANENWCDCSLLAKIGIGFAGIRHPRWRMAAVNQRDDNGGYDHNCRNADD